MKPIIKRNFWEEPKNDQLLLIQEFKDLFEKDKTKDKKESSMIMWAVYFACDYYTRYSEVPQQDRIIEIEKSLFNDPGYFTKNRKVLEPLMTKYNKLQETSPRKYLITFLETIEKRRMFLENVEYDNHTAKAIDDMLLNSSKLFQQEKDIQTMLASKGESIIKGDVKLSLMDLGLVGDYEGS